MKEIQLNKGKITLVDDEDLAKVCGHKWYAEKNRNTFYARSMIDGKIVYMHRLLMGLTDRRIQCDHEDHDGLNNRRNNLRTVNNSFNNHQKNKNRTFQGKQPTSRFKGVSWSSDCKKWLASACIDGKRFYLGVYADEEAAARAYDKKIIEHLGLEKALIGKVLNFDQAELVTP